MVTHCTDTHGWLVDVGKATAYRVCRCWLPRNGVVIGERQLTWVIKSENCGCKYSAQYATGLTGAVTRGFKWIATSLCNLCNPKAQQFYQRKKAKTNQIMTCKALAHKIARACYCTMDNRCPLIRINCLARY